MAPSRERPVIISILTWNKLELLRNCIESIFKNTRYPFYRICVFDQASTDGTREYLESLGDKIDVIHSPENIGFVLGNNQVFKKYPDNDILLLNNDTLVTDGWLEALVECAYSAEDIGIVGAKLIYPDGRLQEAGGEVFRDGSARNIGKYDDPNKPEYNLLREVDYCSGACLYIKRDLLNRIGGFDERFVPGYCEDTDICFRAREVGFKVMYQPKSVVVHLEGATATTDVRRGLKRYQPINQRKFYKKWKEVLKHHRRSAFEVPSKEGKEKILIVSHEVPMYDKGAGEVRTHWLAKALTKYYTVVLLCYVGVEKYIRAYQEMGITVFQELFKPSEGGEVKECPIDFKALFTHNDFKIILFNRYEPALRYIDYIQRFSPNSLLVLDSQDIHFLREEREAAVLKRDDLLWKAQQTKKEELATYEKMDVIVTVTDEDRERILAESSNLDVRTIPGHGAYKLIDESVDSERKDLIFVGGFRHTPNVDAIQYFCKEIFPLIKKELPDVKLFVVGSNPPPEVLALGREDIIVTGYVPDIQPYFRACRISVAPLRYGAGMKGKIADSMAAGLPVVTTSIGAEGMGLIAGVHLLVADAPADFAKAVVLLYKDEALWERLSQNGRRFIQEKYNPEVLEKKWIQLLSSLSKRPKREGKVFRIDSLYTPPKKEKPSKDQYKRLQPRPIIVPQVTIVIPTFNRLELTKRCIESIRLHTQSPYEILAVDNGSADGTVQWLERNSINYIENKQNMGFGYACNQGIMSSYSDYVVILHNDVVVTSRWLESLINHMEKDPSLGIIGPCTNLGALSQRIPVDYEMVYQLESFAWRRYQENKGKSEPVEYLGGLCLLIPRWLINNIGLFDTRLKGGFESWDLCLRSRLAGYKVAVARDVFVHHFGGRPSPSIEESGRLFSQKWGISAQRRFQSIMRLNEDRPQVSIYVNITADWKQSIESLQRFTTLPFEVIFIVDDLKDESMKSIKRARLIEKDGSHLLKVIARDMKNALGEWIAILSSDVLLTPNWLEQLISCLENNPEVGIVGPISNIADEEAQLIKPEYKDLEEGLQRFATMVHSKDEGKWTQTQTLDDFCLVMKKALLHDIIQKTHIDGFDSLFKGCREKGYKLACAKDTFVHRFRVPIRVKEPPGKLISVIIPTFNKREILLRTLRSLWRQDLSTDDFEILVVDDGSTDGTQEALHKLSAPCSLRYYYQEHKGQVAAINLGIRKARGEFVFLTCADMIATKGLLKEHIRTHRRFPKTDIAVVGGVLYHPELNITPFMKYLMKAFDRHFALARIKDKEDIDPDFFLTSNASAKREVLIDIGPCDEELSYDVQDMDLGYRLKLKGCRLVYNENALCYHHHATDLRNYCQRQRIAGRGAALFASKHPSLIDIISLKESVFRNYLGNKELIECSFNMIDLLEGLPSEIRDSIVVARSGNGQSRTPTPLLNFLYSLVTDYYFAEGVKEKIEEIEGEGWYCHQKYHDILTCWLESNKRRLQDMKRLEFWIKSKLNELRSNECETHLRKGCHENLQHNHPGAQ